MTHPLLDKHRLRISKASLDILLPRIESVRDPEAIDCLRTIDSAMTRANGSKLVWLSAAQLAVLEKLAGDSALAIEAGPGLETTTAMRRAKSSLQHLARNARILAEGAA